MEVFLVFYFVWLSIQVVNFHTCEERYTVSSLVEPKIYLISTVEINKKWSPCFRSIYFSMLQKRIWVERIRVWTGGTRSSLWWCCRWVSFFIFLFIIIICFINTLDKCQKWLKQHRFNLEHVQFTMVTFKPFISFTEIFFK